MTKNSFEDEFALKPIKADQRIKQLRFLKPETIKRYKAIIKNSMKNDLISVDGFNNKGHKNGSKDS